MTKRITMFHSVSFDWMIPVEERPGRQDLWRITRDEKGFAHTHLLPVRFVPLVEGLPGGN